MNLRPCTSPGCINRAQQKSSKCKDCEPKYKRGSQANPGERGYTPGWAMNFLYANPFCAHNIPGVCTVAASLADHFPRSRKELEADPNVDDPNDEQYLVPSCQACHRKITAQRQPGGWNRKDWER